MLTPTEFLKIEKAAMRRLVKACGGQEACVLIEGMPIRRHQTFSEYGSLGHPEVRPPRYVIALLEIDCGDPIYTRAMARLSQHDVVPIQPGAIDTQSLAGTLQATGMAMKEASDVFARVGEASADGRISAREIIEINSDVDEAIRALMALKRAPGAEGGEQ